MEELRLSIPDVYVVANAVEKAITEKAFDREYVEKIFPAWTKVMAFCESIKRKSEIEDLYKETVQDDSSDDVRVPVIPEETLESESMSPE